MHPTNDKGRLTSKFLSRMMLKCIREITPEQVTYLQEYKSVPNTLDYLKHESLITIDWEELRYQGDLEDAAASKPVEMTPEETLMSNEVEELSEDMKREIDSEGRKNLGKTSLAFMDLESMSTTSRFVYLGMAFALFSGLIIYFYNVLLVKEEDPNKVRRAKIDAKRASKKS